ncbi:MAG TPA: hypothetical protein EYG52_14035 [Pseudomonadales bacterium]|nr:hypothetical protein [Gammaproteobacteria bacterium]HIL84616.1 hypothetical protein [Pseudomonadales bacterium]
MYEELQKINRNDLAANSKASKVTEETVSINSNQDLERFVRRIVSISQDRSMREAIETGRHVFRLRPAKGVAVGANDDFLSPAANTSAAVSFEQGLVTEKQAMNIPEHIKTVRVAKGVRLTPLASDVIRRSGKTIERLTK